MVTEFGSAVIALETDADGSRHAVVKSADRVIGISCELLEDSGKDVGGALVRNGNTVEFGSPGRGLGRLTYRIIEHDFARHIVIAVRQ